MGWPMYDGSVNQTKLTVNVHAFAHLCKLWMNAAAVAVARSKLN